MRTVYEKDKEASEYLRYFEAEEVDHCRIGFGGHYPGDALRRLVEWVEEEKAPERLEARIREGKREGRRAELCMWPKKMVYLGGSFGCE